MQPSAASVKLPQIPLHAEPLAPKRGRELVLGALSWMSILSTPADGLQPGCRGCFICGWLISVMDCPSFVCG